ncbi:hypothetical protein PRIPAC_80138, partial [Pristionchus pacificus]|uniref:Sugar transporter SWEET n=1 Tax=Pristionchus pacificus TaxID=54126 RepID=A0A2A6BE20_PRIPA
RERRRKFILLSHSMDLLQLFGIWVSCMQISLLALPLSLVNQWRLRGSSHGFSVIQLLIPIPIQICWLRYGYLTVDMLMITTNVILLATSIAYLFIFIYYLPDKSTIVKEVSIMCAVIILLMIYVSIHPHNEQANIMGKIAPLVQNTRIMGAAHQLKDIIDKKTTEFLPYQMPFVMCAFISQNALYSFLAEKSPVVWASIPGLFFNFTFLIMYIVYPPKTWRVPIIGTGKKITAGEKKE